MNQLMALLLPSIIGVKQNEKINGEIKGKRRIIEAYLKSILFANLICYLITIYVFKQPYIVFTYQFTVKYILLALLVSYIFPIIEKFLKDNISIEIKVEKNEEKN